MEGSELITRRAYNADVNRKSRSRRRDYAMERLVKYHEDIISESWIDDKNEFRAGIEMDFDTIMNGYNLISDGQITHTSTQMQGYITRLKEIMGPIWEYRKKNRLRTQRLRRRNLVDRTLMENAVAKPSKIIPTIKVKAAPHASVRPGVKIIPQITVKDPPKKIMLHTTLKPAFT